MTTSNTSLILPLHYKINPKHVQFYDKVDAGGFGEIYRGAFNGQPVAIKKFKSDILEDFHHELNMMYLSQHPNVVTLYGYFTMPETGSYCMVLEYMKHGTMTDWLVKYFHHSKSSPTDLLTIILYIAYKIALAIHWMHTRGVIHRDLKPDNILVDDDSVKLCDFGLSCQMNYKLESSTVDLCSSPNISNNSSTKMTTTTATVGDGNGNNNTKKRKFSRGNKVDPFNKPDKKRKSNDQNAADGNNGKEEGKYEHGWVGTDTFQAPEILNECPYDSKCDVFSFGMTLCYLLRGDDPYLHVKGQTATKKILKSERPPLPRYVPKPITDLVRDCWKHAPSQRPNMHTVLQRLTAFLTSQHQHQSTADGFVCVPYPCGWGTGQYFEQRKPEQLLQTMCRTFMSALPQSHQKDLLVEFKKKLKEDRKESSSSGTPSSQPLNLSALENGPNIFEAVLRKHPSSSPSSQSSTKNDVHVLPPPSGVVQLHDKYLGCSDQWTSDN